MILKEAEIYRKENCEVDLERSEIYREPSCEVDLDKERKDKEKKERESQTNITKQEKTIRSFTETS